MHEALPPRSASGVPFYDSVLTVAEGIAIKTATGVRPPVELGEVVAQQPASRRLRIPIGLRLR